jgi:hypothetical protein
MQILNGAKNIAALGRFINTLRVRGLLSKRACLRAAENSIQFPDAAATV